MTLQQVRDAIIACEKCPRLVNYLREVATRKKREFQHWTYWGRPIPGFGDSNARLLVVGLAPAAHGGNRTGRAFTGDASADWLLRAMHRVGFANQPRSETRDDGLRLIDAYIGMAARCAPPQNRPLAEELRNCLPYLVDEMKALPRLRVVLALGKIGFDASLRALVARGIPLPRPRPRFAHGATYRLTDTLTLLASYHPSRQNTQTGRLTEAMLDEVFARARALLSTPSSYPDPRQPQGRPAHPSPA